MSNRLKCEYLETSEERLMSKDDANSVTSACSQAEETRSTVTSDQAEAPSRKHDAAIERAVTGEDLSCPRAGEQVLRRQVEPDEGPVDEVAK